MIRPKTAKTPHPSPRRASILLSFEAWNELRACGDVKEKLEEIIQNWLAVRLAERDIYFISNDRRVIDVKMPPITEKEISIVEDQLANARALGHNKKAYYLEMRLEALKSNFFEENKLEG